MSCPLVDRRFVNGSVILLEVTLLTERVFVPPNIRCRNFFELEKVDGSHVWSIAGPYLPTGDEGIFNDDRNFQQVMKEILNALEIDIRMPQVMMMETCPRLICN